ncbi:transketolase [Aliifodinibius sp. S!AR15-10]|uniref:transketolase n=1 Tax=Aliifodinibius sp. S!AR15-10 TaxID=2950437 RepID=UPI0028633677|nr:transketolase [Aliifodinibius sp. S!AR15-10]MDR8389812.1 transketolase [Aliifodinibius sp. S!AR15-10]
MTKTRSSEVDLVKKSAEYRKRILSCIKNAGAGHTAGSLSCIDILNVLYNRVMNVSPENFGDKNRDRYIQSKGHSVEALYVTLSDQGFFPDADIDTFSQYQSHYVGHPTRKVAGVEHNTGALGHGLSMSVGIALAGKMDKAPYKVYTLLGDGELAEGSNWEALMAASHYKLDNLVAIVDYNKLQITGPVSNVCNVEPLREKFESFGWHVREVDGHNLDAMEQLFKSAPFEKNKPNMVIAHTTKGKGISFIEGNYKWHHKVPDDEQYEDAIAELSQVT